MNILIMSQVYAPDTVSVSQHLSDFAEYLVASGHSVRVVASKYQYEDGSGVFPRTEILNGVDVTRIEHFKASKASFWLRSLTFLSFNVKAFFSIISMRANPDAILGTTVPPFSPFFCIILSRLLKAPYLYWVMDLQPELAINSGLIASNSLSARVFRWIGEKSIKNSRVIYSLDRYMTAYLVSKGANPSSIVEVPVWPVSLDFYDGAREKNAFRLENKFGDDLVVMFSGNHAHVHPLDTILEAARKLENLPIKFVFVGGGVRKKEVGDWKERHNLKNIHQLPFQPRENFHISIGSSDIQVVIMGEKQVGYTHPNKIYGAMLLSKLILYVGPKDSHITDILSNNPGNILVKHGQSMLLAKKLRDLLSTPIADIQKVGRSNRAYALKHFNPERLMSKMERAFTDIGVRPNRNG